MPANLFALQIVIFLLAFWLGTFLLGREPSRAALRNPGLGLLVYAMALAGLLRFLNARRPLTRGWVWSFMIFNWIAVPLTWLAALLGWLPLTTAGNWGLGIGHRRRHNARAGFLSVLCTAQARTTLATMLRIGKPEDLATARYAVLYWRYPQ